jgi:hypothetical protein
MVAAVHGSVCITSDLFYYLNNCNTNEETVLNIKCDSFFSITFVQTCLTLINI